MKWWPVLCLMFFSFSQGCKKVNPATHIALEINYLNGNRAIEWQHIEGYYVKENGKIMIHAEGAADESFKLELLQVADTGSIHNLALTQMFFTDDVLFQPSQLTGSSVFIETLHAQMIKGSFKGKFSSATEQKEIEGKFAMHIF